jgi:HSP20 family molecular chaperone IbpA
MYAMINKFFEDALLPEFNTSYFRDKVITKDNVTTITLEVPGLSSKDLDINLSGDLIKISAGDQHIRSFKLSKSLDLDSIQANTKHGLLTITIPNKQSKSRKISIKDND